MKLVLQNRDREILKYAFTFRVVTYEQIRKRYFSTNKDSAARKRIRDLCNAKLLTSFFIQPNKKPVKCVSLNANAWKHIVEKWDFDIDQPLFKSESPDHDVRLAEVHSKFESLTLYSDFKTENIMQSAPSLASNPEYRDLINIQADGALALKDKSGNKFLYAIELEISKKTIDRYQKKLSAYYRTGGIDGVIYICANQEIKDLIARTDKEIRTTKKSIVYLGEETSVLKSSGKMFFKNVEVDGIGLF